MNENHLARRAAACTALALLTAILLAACGSSTSSSSSTSASAASGASTRRTALVTCLRKHGVTLPRGVPGGGRPSGAPGAGGGSGGGGFGGGGAHRLANRSKFQVAFKACGTNFARGGPRFAFSQQAISKYLTCVRQHGYQLPAPNFSGYGPVFPAGIRSNAKFQKASAACQSLLRPSGAPGSPGAPPGG